MAVKKRFHQSRKDRRDERMGELRHMRHERHDRMDERIGEDRYLRHSGHLGPDMYSGPENRRSIEDRDFRMISEDKHAIANMPQSVMYKPWPKNRHYYDEGLDDTIRGINDQIDDDVRGMEKHLSYKKY